MDNARIADQLEALAGLFELAEANPYSARAYRRAAETVRGAPTPVAELVRSGRVRQLRGIGPSIEAKLRELVETGAIAELAELERELAPELVGFGRYLGLTAKRTLELARALDVRTAGELREAALAGRLRSARGVGPRTEARLLEALARAEPPRPRQGPPAQPRPRTRAGRSRTGSAAPWPGTRGAGGTSASTSPSCAPRPTRGPS